MVAWRRMTPLNLFRLRGVTIVSTIIDFTA